jgi:hypothetical protein
MPEDLEIIYRARGGRQPVDLDLALGADGQATLFLGSSSSIPLQRVNRVGRFGGLAPAVEMAALGAYLDELDLLTRAGTYGEATPDSPDRFLQIRAGEREARFELAGLTDDAALGGFEELLHELALALTRQPVAAVEATLDLLPVEGQLAATIALRSVGLQPLEVLLVDPVEPVFTLRAWVELEGKMPLPTGDSLAMPLGRSALPPEAVQALVEDGTLPSGIVQLSPRMVYRIGLSLTAPRTALPVVATGGLVFWQPDGQVRRLLTLLTPETPLP